jgi:hypothetical protein
VTTTPLPDRLYEARVEPEEGFYLPTGDTWRGYRVRYRPLGTRRWSTFLLVEQEEPPTVEQLQLLCHAHFTGAAK